MIYEFVLGDHTIHIKSDVVSQMSDSEDERHHDEDDDEDDGEDDDEDDEDEDEEDDDMRDEEEDDDEEDEEDNDDGDMHDDEEDEEDGERPADEERPADLLEISSDDRGPLYHSTCNEELLHPKDAQLYRIRSVEANGSRDSRVQSDIVVNNFKHVKRPELSDAGLEYETIGSLGEEDKPTVQLKLAFLRLNKQVYQEASTLLYSTRTFGFDDPTTFAQFFSIRYNHIAQPPTSTNGTNLLATKRHFITSVHLRAKTALCVGQKIKWMAALDAATFVLPELEKIRVLFDLCHEGNEKYVDGTRWQFHRHRHGFPLLKTAEVRVTTDLLSFPMREDTDGKRLHEFRDVGWRVELFEAILGHHMDILFGASLLDPAAVAARNATFL